MLVFLTNVWKIGSANQVLAQDLTPLIFIVLLTLLLALLKFPSLTNLFLRCLYTWVMAGYLRHSMTELAEAVRVVCSDRNIHIQLLHSCLLAFWRECINPKNCTLRINAANQTGNDESCKKTSITNIQFICQFTIINWEQRSMIKNSLIRYTIFKAPSASVADD